MKKFLSAVLSVLMLASVMSLAGCGNDSKTTSSGDGKTESGDMKFGMGVYTAFADVINAEEDANGSVEVDHTVAAVLLDKDGKIVKCVIDTAAPTLEFTSDGKAVEATEFKTKYELKDDYGMVAYGGAEKEWYEQADAFCSAVVGKTIDEVKAIDMENSDNDIVKAGCTIGVSDFILALEKAVKNAAASNATADDTLKLGIVTTPVGSAEADSENDGTNDIDTTVVAAVVDKDSKVVAMDTDVVSISVTFDASGASTTDTAAEIKTKKELGDDYGMVAYGDAKKEWYEQAAAFNTACKGLDAKGIAKFVTEDSDIESLQSAGCTIDVSDMVKAAVKAAE